MHCSVIEVEGVKLTTRETQIVMSLVIGETAREVALRLGVSFHTVRTHIKNVYSKLGVVNRVELVRLVDERSGRHQVTQGD
jgi:DNA-binding CsgD family transcriptional regulator